MDQTATTGETVAPAAPPYTLTPPAECPLDEPRYFTELRSACPVSHVSVGSQDNVVLFTKYDDVKAILSDTRFSSNPPRKAFRSRARPARTPRSSPRR